MAVSKLYEQSQMIWLATEFACYAIITKPRHKKLFRWEKGGGVNWLSEVNLNNAISWAPYCIKLTINGKLDLNGNFHRILDADWL